MLPLLIAGQISPSLFIFLLITLVISLSFHEFGHAIAAKWYGDNTAQLAGRLTLNPIAHIDPMGLIMVLLIGFGYAKPVPTDPRNFKSSWASPVVAFAGPGMNLLIAFVMINTLQFGVSAGWGFLQTQEQINVLAYLAGINVLLALFNLLPIGALDGHYILPAFLSRDAARRYNQFNDQYGNMILLSLIVLSILGVPIFRVLLNFAGKVLNLITVVPH